MAVKNSFKQPCPSCEAMVPIRDVGLIGKKIDCPKCKYRFVVEEPPEEEADDEASDRAAAKGKSSGITKSKKSANGKAATLPRRGEENEVDEADDRPKKKEGGGSGMLILGLGLAAVAVIVLALGGWLLMSNDDGAPKTSGTPPQASGSGPAVGGGETKQEKKKEEPKVEAKPRLADATNLLPNDTQVVVNLPMERLLGNPSFKKAALLTPGSFNEIAFQKTWGVPAADIAHAVIALNLRKKTAFSVLQTSKSLKEKKIVKDLKIQAEKPINGRTYYLLRRSLDSLTNFLLQIDQNRGAMALYFWDDHTLVCANVGPMQEFLNANGKPKRLSEGPGSASEEPKQGSGGQPAGGQPAGGQPGKVGGPMATMGGSGGPPGGGGGPPGGGGGPPAGMRGGSRPPGAGGPPQGGGSRPPGTGGPPPGVGGPPQGAGGPPGAGAGSSGFVPPSGFPPGMGPPNQNRGSTVSIAGVASASYLTIDPSLKAVLDQVEQFGRIDRGPLVSGAMLLSSLTLADYKKFVGNQLDAEKIPDLGLKASLRQFKDVFKSLAVGVLDFSDTRLSAAVAVGTRDGKVATELQKAIAPALPLFVELSKLDILDKSASNQDQSASRPGGPMMPNFPGGMGGPPAGVGSGAMGPGNRPGGGMTGPPPGVGSGAMGPGRGPGGGGAGGPPPGVGSGAMGPGRGGPGAFGPGMGGQQQQQQQQEEAKGKDGDYTLWTKENVLALGLNLVLKDAWYQDMAHTLEGALIYLKGMAEMADNRWRIHSLAEATQAYLKDKGHFPRGTQARPPSSDRGIDWRPDQRFSWMADMLPYVSGGDYKDLPLDNDKSWDEPPVNLHAALTLVPEFLAPTPPDKPSSYYIHYPGLSAARLPVAATSYVGMAGVGLDAAEYRENDKATAKKRGIFGYNRKTKPEEIKDGPENTILLIQVPPDHKSPWIAGGGSTVRGVSEEADCVQPFVCTKYQGKDGTFAIMADGKVRFIPATIDPKIFRALCTISGGEKIKDLDGVAPEVPVSAAETKEAEPERKKELAAPPGKQAQNDPRKDLQKLQGAWTIVGGEAQGQTIGASSIQQLAGRVVFTDDKYVLTTKQSSEEGTFKLNEATDPKTFDMEITKGKDQGKKQLGIYSLSGDELKLCFASPGQPRPTSFATKAGSADQLFVLQRAKR